MASKPDIYSMWINPRSNLHGGSGHPASYGEGQSTHNSRFLKLAEILMSLNAPERMKARAAAAGTDKAAPNVAVARITLAS
jgi:hypothetical protein